MKKYGQIKPTKSLQLARGLREKNLFDQKLYWIIDRVAFDRLSAKKNQGMAPIINQRINGTLSTEIAFNQPE